MDQPPENIQDNLSDIKGKLFVSFNGHLSKTEFESELMKTDKGGKVPKYKRYFCDKGQLFNFENRTIALTNQWGNETIEAANRLCTLHAKIEYKKE